MLACAGSVGGGAFAEGRADLVSREPADAIVDGVAGAAARSDVAAPLCVAVGGGGLGGAVGAAGSTAVSAPVCDEVVGEGATGGAGFGPAQPAVRRIKRRPIVRVTRINDSSARTSVERQYPSRNYLRFMIKSAAPATITAMLTQLGMTVVSFSVTENLNGPIWPSCVSLV